MKKFLGNYGGSLIVAAVLFTFTLTALFNPLPIARAVGPTQTSYFITAPSGSDPCENPSVVKSSGSISVASATTTNLVTAVAGDFISVCKWQVYASGTAPTIQFEYGTDVSTACDTGATALMGAFPVATTTIVVNAPSDGLTLRTPVSQELCLVTGGSSTLSYVGYFTYVQAPY